jgi:hypothetical protein
MKTIQSAGKAVGKYVFNLKNFITHGLIGLLILAAMIWLPVKPVHRLLIFILIIIVNLVRMRWEKNKKLKERVD